MRRLLCLAAVLGVGPILAFAAPAAPAAAASREAGGDGMYAYLTRDGATFKAPLFAEDSENLPVALVDDDPITLRELMKAIGGLHATTAAGKQAGKKDFAPILDRLIEGRLITHEARQMGIPDLPEHKQAVEKARAAAGREILQARVLKNVRADPAEVDRLYKRATREWKVRSVLVPNRDDVNAFEKQIKAGGKFEALAAKLVAAKKAKGGDGTQWVGRATGLPVIVSTLDAMKVGAVSQAVKLPEGFTVMKLEAVRNVDSPKDRESATETSLAGQRKAAVKKYYDGLVKRYAHVDQKLLDSIDFEAAKPGMLALEKDERVLARIEGGKPITVADLTDAVEQAFFHGVGSAIKEKRVNREKMKIWDGMLSTRVVPAEVKRLEIEKTPEFKERVADAETALLFSKFVEKAILADMKLGDDQFRKYYADHQQEFTYPTFYKLESIAFTSLKAGEAAIKQLRGGTDFKWLNANADGQVKAGERKLAVEGTLSAKGLPKSLAALLQGAHKDDYRLWADDANQQWHAIHVIDVTGATAQPYEEAKAQIQEKVFQETLQAAIKGWAEKLRKQAQVRILLTRIGS